MGGTLEPTHSSSGTNGFSLKGDNLHFNANGQQALGSAFAEETAYYSWIIETFPPADIAAGLAEPDADRDGDGQANRDEFISASNPLSATSSFRSSFRHLGATLGEIAYETSSARTYEVQRYEETSTSWVPALPALRGTGATVTRPLELSGSWNFFRIRANLP